MIFNLTIKTLGYVKLAHNGFWARAVRAFKDTPLKIRTKEEERKKDRKATKPLLLLCPVLAAVTSFNLIN